MSDDFDYRAAMVHANTALYHLAIAVAELDLGVPVIDRLRKSLVGTEDTDQFASIERAIDVAAVCHKHRDDNRSLDEVMGDISDWLKQHGFPPDDIDKAKP